MKLVKYYHCCAQLVHPSSVPTAKLLEVMRSLYLLIMMAHQCDCNDRSAYDSREYQQNIAVGVDRIEV